MYEAMAEAGLQEVETYVSRHQNTFAQLITTRTIMDLCLVSERCLGLKLANQFWEDERMRTSAWEAERKEGGDTMGISLFRDAPC